MTKTGWKCICVFALMLCGTTVVNAATINVPIGGDLQAALNAAQPGDTILLAEGAEFVGNFVLPVKSGSTWITLRTSAPDTLLPPSGQRINPSHAPLLARLRSPNSAVVLRTAPGAHHWRLAYLELAANYQGYGDIMQIGDGSNAQNTIARVPHHFALEHLYVHGDPNFGQKRCIALNAAHVTITDSYIAECKAVGQDTQAIGGWNGPGPYVIENNYLEAAGENFLLGGADPAITDLVPTGVTFRRNYLSRPMAWRNPIINTPQRVRLSAQSGGSLAAGVYAYRVVARRSVGQGSMGRSTASAEVTVTVATAASAVRVQWDAVPGVTEYRVYGRTAGSQNAYWRVTTNELIDTGAAGTAENVPTSGGTRWSVKNLFELKNARNVVIENNIMENHWQESQPGYAVVFTPRNSGGRCTWCVIENVRFEYNIVRNVSAGVNLLGRDGPVNTTRQTTNVAFRHNLFAGVTTALGGNAYFMLIGDSPRDVDIEHNTFDGNGSSVIYAYGGTSTNPDEVTGFLMTANAAPHGKYGIGGQHFTAGNGILNGYFPGAFFATNYLAGGLPSRYPAGNLFAGLFADQFVNAAGGDFTVREGSPLKRAASDGTDIGVDFAAIMSRTAGVEVGGASGGVAPTPPAAEFTQSCTGLACTFTDASVAGSVPISSHTWSFGDGTGGTGPAATHAYTAAGTYQTTLTVRDGNGLSSSVSQSVTVEPTTLPSDLVVAGLTVPATVLPGTTMQVTDTTRNPGTGTAEASQTVFYLSKDARLDTTDTLLGLRSVPELAPGAASTSTTSVAVPPGLQSGSYFVLAQADGENTVAESSETNNVAAAGITMQADPIVRADLIVSTFTVPATAAPGGTILVTDTTANQSAGPAPATATRFFLSTTMFLDATDTTLQTRIVAALAPNGVSTASTSVTIPAGTRPGMYYLLAQADADGVVAEFNEINNTRWAAVRIGPDLIVSALTAPVRAVAGTTLAVTETTRNSGAGTAAGSSTAFYLSANTSLDPSDIRLEPSRVVPALATSASSTATTTITLPIVPAGTWYVLATADDASDVIEVNEVNNVRFATVQVGPDLSFLSVTVPATGVAGTPVSVASVVRNGGAEGAPPSLVRFYLSTNATFDGADVALNATRPVPALLPSGSHSATTSVPLPLDKIGNFYLLLVVDAEQVVPESSEVNNIVARAIQITR